ncbi:cytochrome P450, partial [Streptomyces rubellomurinus subsp. indigoferus]
MDSPVGGPGLVVVAAADRVAGRLADETRLHLARADSPHLGFRHGLDYCIGAPLPRLEGRAALATLLSRLPDLRLAEKPEELRWRGGLI